MFTKLSKDYEPVSQNYLMTKIYLQTMATAYILDQHRKLFRRHRVLKDKNNLLDYMNDEYIMDKF